jgi:hypothetical protein
MAPGTDANTTTTVAMAAKRAMRNDGLVVTR